MSFMQNKRVLITGLISNKSMSYGIAKAMHREGAQLAFTYQNERFKDRVEKMAAEFDSQIAIPCDVSNDEEIANVFTQLKKHWDGFDGLVHSIAFAPADQLQGNYLENLTREGFSMAHDISSYSFAALAKYAAPMMEGRDAAMVAMTYIGATRAIPNYNLMGVAKASLEANMRYMAASLGPKGIRVNAISAGPVRTLAASGIKGFRKMLDANEKVVPLRANTTIEQVGNTAAFLCSDLSRGITGDILFVDGGFHIMSLASLAEE
ncbi:MAG: enoyl-[acyl-carrier-protein] reductase FabI [Legionellaceae bacterium]|nr:enoyl-[acyl-carrier-protein] reductase FabI [Legionellaceae bacterium]